ncbi:cytoplasmic tRNA 2-thiolation protein 2-like [Zingiber officinale]|uniref:cytoplasmic tRNA 2-thiolation protein 2-like n=1 Tax=Zingiber officinale TaxID=94328 RepID=UPI001C4CE279|nr:cytoplasmic tRNA 2-thiolation protein 2-like [Zingiber officinale]XP_042401662.1 cytoplasmic tRNA 2-thiolation protein 2-like [Zingiber officinale]
MASCGSACDQSHCRRPDDSGGAEEDVPERFSASRDSDTSKTAGDGDLARCSKCGEEPKAGTHRVLNGMCASCFRSYLYGKFKLAVSTNAMISPTDKILVAFSGGPGSRVALQFVHEMQKKSLESWDASKSQSLPVFGVGVAFVDESISSVIPSPELGRIFKHIKLIVSSLVPGHKDLHIAPIEDVCSMGSDDGTTRLNKLLNSVSDATGKEDFLDHLCILSLQKIALDNGYTKLVVGSCSSTIARHVISATVKGQGYSLPADVQYVDARWEVPVVLPLRDCLTDELSLLCQLDGLETLQLSKRPSSSNSINSLVSSFISRLQDDNPARERTIVRTAEKLKPFGFNKFVENKYHEFIPSRLRCKFQNTNNGESDLAEVFCTFCMSPLSESELHDMHGKSQTLVDTFTAACCQSCSFQILPKESESLQHFLSFLPQSMTRKVADSTLEQSLLREMIDDCLLVDDDADGDRT